MKYRHIWLSSIFVCVCFAGWTQGFVENALLFSRTRPGGSARIQAMGGAQTALGGDYSSALSNPAGLGMYNRSEVTFSPALNFYQTDAEHLGSETSDSKSVFNIPGLSFVYHKPVEKNKFLGGSFGITMTRINDFNNSIQYKAEDNSSSIIDYFRETAQGYAIDPLQSPYDDIPLLNYDFPEGLAYLTYLINPVSDDPANMDPVMPDDYITYFSELDTLPGEIRTLTRDEVVKTSGAQYQWSFAYGGNFNDKLFFGASIGVTTLRYKFSRDYHESGYQFSSDATYDPLDYMRHKESITIDGSGINLTLGVIYRPVNSVQIGASFETPTTYQLSDSYTATIQTQWNDGRGFIEESSFEPITVDYNLTTPLKFSTGASFFFGKYGFISGDVEFVNYGNAKYKSDVDDISFDLDNQDINYYYGNVINYRVGAEFRYSIYRFRGGYNFQSNPYKEFDVDRSVTSASMGAGIKLNRFSIDFAWLTSKSKGSYSPYVFESGTGPVANLSTKASSAMITLGYAF